MYPHPIEDAIRDQPLQLAASGQVTVEAVPVCGQLLAQAETLLRGYCDQVRCQYRAEPALGELILDQVTWLDADGRLQEVYRAPLGALFIAHTGSDPAGCVAIRRLNSLRDSAEIKRLYVRQSHRGMGVARALLRRAESEARRLGFRRLALESGDRQTEALRLYRASGFSPIPPYRALPADIAHRFHTLALTLAPG